MEARRGTRPALWIALASTGLALAAYGLTLCRTVYFGDSAELSAAAARLGVAHPPGYPLYLLLARLLVIFTPGEPALAVNLLSALAAVTTAGLAAWLALALGASRPAALAAGIFAAGSRLVWAQAVVAEVYTVHAALLLGVLVACERYHAFGDRRWLLLGSYLLGLGLAHHLTIVYAGVAALALVLPRWKTGWRSWPAAGAVASLGLTLYAVLLVRSHFDPPLDWGNPETLDRLRDHVSARPYQFLVGKLRTPDMLRRLGEILGLLFRDLHPALFPAAFVGLIVLWRRPAVLLALGLAIGLFIVHAVAYGIPDIQAHLVPAAALFAVISALGLDAAIRFASARALPAPRGRGLHWLAPALAIGLLAAHRGESDRHAHRSAREFGENLLRSLPERAVLLAEGDNQVFLLAYLTAACGARPDLTIVDRDGNLLADFYGVRAESGRPLAGDFQEERLRVEKTAVPAWLGEDPPRAVFTSGRTNLPDQVSVTQESSGLLMRLRWRGAPSDPSASDSLTADSLAANPANPMTADSLAADPRDPWAVVQTEAIRRDQVRGDLLTREVAARYWVRRGEAAFERQDLAAMTAAFDSALAVAPQSPDLASYLGAFHAQNEMLERAIPLLQQAVRQNPLSVRGWTNLGLALIKSGRRAEGLSALRESLRIQPEQGWVRETVRRLSGSP